MNSKNLYRSEEPKKLSANAKAAIGTGVVLVAAASAVLAISSYKKATAENQSEPAKYVIEDSETSAQVEQQKKQHRRREALASIGSVLLGVVSFLVTGALQLGGSAVAGLAGAAGGALAMAAQYLVVFSSMMLLFGIVFKRLYPERKLRELYTLKNVLWMLGGSAVITAASILSAAFLTIAPIYIALIQSAVASAVYAFVWYRVFRQKGYYGEQVKKSVFGLQGAAALTGIAGATVGVSFLKVWLASLSATMGSVSVAVAAFLLCAVVSAAGFGIVRSVQRRLDIRNEKLRLDSIKLLEE